MRRTSCTPQRRRGLATPQMPFHSHMESSSAHSRKILALLSRRGANACRADHDAHSPTISRRFTAHCMRSTEISSRENAEADFIHGICSICARTSPRNSTGNHDPKSRIKHKVRASAQASHRAPSSFSAQFRNFAIPFPLFHEHGLIFFWQPW